MPEINLKTSPKKRGGWLRKLAWFAGIFIILLVAIYFVATSTAFLKGVILPQVGKVLDADVTVADVQISPFSHVMIRGLKVQPHGGDTLLAVQEVRASYIFWDIIGGETLLTRTAIAYPYIT